MTNKSITHLLEPMQYHWYDITMEVFKPKKFDFIHQTVSRQEAHCMSGRRQISRSYWLLILLTAKYLSSRYEVMTSLAVPPCCSWDMLHTMGTHTRSPLLLGFSQLCRKEEIPFSNRTGQRIKECINVMCNIGY